MDKATEKPSSNRWLVVIGTALVQISVGSFYAWSIFNTGFELKGGGVMEAGGSVAGGPAAASVSFTFTLGMLFLALSTLAGIPLAKKFGIRPVAIVGSIIFGLSIIALTTATNLALLWIFGGVLLGAMDGILYMTTLTNAIKWFPEHKGLVSGISVACYGLGSFIFKFVDQAIAGGKGSITGANIDHVLLWWGILALVIALLGSLLLKDAPEIPAPAADSAEADNDFTTKEMLKTPQAYMIVFTLITAVMFMGILGAAVTGLAQKWTGAAPIDGVAWTATSAAATFVAAVAVANTLGRFIMGTLSDIIGRKGVFFITFIAQLLTVIALLATAPGKMNMGVMYLVIVVMAFCFGGNITVFPTFVADYFGLKNSARNYSILYQGFGIGALIVGFLMATGNPLAPKVLNAAAVAAKTAKPATSNFNLTLTVLLVMVILSLVIFVFIKPPKKNA